MTEAEKKKKRRQKKKNKKKALAEAAIIPATSTAVSQHEYQPEEIRTDDVSSEEEASGEDSTAADPQFDEQLRVFEIRLAHINDKINSSNKRLKPNVSDTWLKKIKLLSNAYTSAT